jgi:hypothetical protein
VAGKAYLCKKMEEMGRKSKYDSTFKTKVVLDAMKESETLSDLAKKYE